MNISIAMATFNGELYLQEQLSSLAEQRLLPYELVVTDDGSTDSTIHILEDFAHDAPFPVRIYRNKNRLGFADNFLKAAGLCTGDWVAFCDQDDVWLPNKLERCALEFADRSVVFIVHSGTVVDQRLHPMGWHVPAFSAQTTRASLHGDPWGVFAGFAAMVRNDILKLCDGTQRPRHPYFPGARQSHDRWAYFLASVFGRTTMIPDQLVLYRQHATNTYGVKKPSNVGVKRHLGSSFEFLVRSTQSAAAHAAMLETGATAMPSPWQGKARAGANYYRHLQKYLARRAEIHRRDNGLLKRCGALFKNVFCRGYRSTELGGMGIRAFVKDSVMCVFGAVTLDRLARIRFVSQIFRGNVVDREVP